MMKLIKTEFKLSKNNDNGKAGDAQCQPQHVDERKCLIPQHVSREKKKVIPDHNKLGLVETAIAKNMPGQYP